MSYLLSTFRHLLRVGFQRTACIHQVRPQHLQILRPTIHFLLTRRLEMDAMQQGIKQYLDSWT